jgi:hypothetical protein
MRYCLALMLCSSGVAVVPVATNLIPSHTSTPPVAQQQVMSRMDYELLKLDMTLTDAQAQIGRAAEMSRDETAVTYMWTYSDGSAITATFKDNRLTSKKQLGLK